MSVAVYARVSTEDQNLDRQLEAIYEFAQSDIDTVLAEIETHRDRSTGTDTERSGYRDLMAAVETGEHDVVVVMSVLSRVARPSTISKPLRSASGTSVPSCTS